MDTKHQIKSENLEENLEHKLSILNDKLDNLETEYNKFYAQNIKYDFDNIPNPIFEELFNDISEEVKVRYELDVAIKDHYGEKIKTSRIISDQSKKINYEITNKILNHYGLPSQQDPKIKNEVYDKEQKIEMYEKLVDNQKKLYSLMQKKECYIQGFKQKPTIIIDMIKLNHLDNTKKIIENVKKEINNYKN